MYSQQATSTISAIALVVALSSGLRAVGDDVPSALQSQIGGVIKAQDASLESLKVTYTYANKLLGSAADAVAYTPIACLGSDLQVFAFKGPKRYHSYDRTGDLADSTVSLPSLRRLAGFADAQPIVTTANSIIAFNGEVLQRRDPGGRICSVFDRKEIRDQDQYMRFYLALSGRLLADPIDESPKPRPDLRLSDALDSGTCRIRASDEFVDGHRCVVIDWGNKERTTVWCDPALGFAIRRKEFHYHETDVLAWRVTSDSFQEILPGFWLPTHTNADRFASLRAPDKLRDTPLIRYEYTVKSLEVNNVPDEFFELQIPPGVMVADYIHGTEKAPGKVQPKLIDVAANGDYVERPRQTSKLTNRNARNPRQWGWLALLNIIVFAVVLYFAFRRQRV